MSKDKNKQQIYSEADKRSYYANRVNDSHLSERQREYAAKRLQSLCGNATKPATRSTSTSYTAGQKAAFNAGIGYGAAKSNKRVPVRDENKDSFRDGLKRGRSLK